jgi:hypothetical protein
MLPITGGDVAKKSSSERRQERQMKPHAARSATRGLFSEEAPVITVTPSRLATIPKYLVTFGMYELWRRRNTAVVTDQRILLGSGIFRRTEKSIPLRNVMDVVFTRRGINAYAEVAVQDRGKSSVRQVGPLSGLKARRLVTEILRRT